MGHFMLILYSFNKKTNFIGKNQKLTLQNTNKNIKISFDENFW